MTVCIATLYDNSKGFVLTSDQMTTAYFPIGYEFEREEHPALASLFLGWKEGRNWLERQPAEIKREVYD